MSLVGRRSYKIERLQKWKAKRIRVFEAWKALKSKSSTNKLVITNLKINHIFLFSVWWRIDKDSIKIGYYSVCWDHNGRIYADFPSNHWQLAFLNWVKFIPSHMCRRKSTVSWTVRHKVHQLQPSQGKDQTIMFRGSYLQIGRRGKFKAEYPLCYDKSFAIKTKYLLQDVQWLVGSPVSSMGSTTYQVYTDL